MFIVEKQDNVDNCKLVSDLECILSDVCVGHICGCVCVYIYIYMYIFYQNGINIADRIIV